jgi:hypothetical protein
VSGWKQGDNHVDVVVRVLDGHLKPICSHGQWFQLLEDRLVVPHQILQQSGSDIGAVKELIWLGENVTGELDSIQSFHVICKTEDFKIGSFLHYFTYLHDSGTRRRQCSC